MRRGWRRGAGGVRWMYAREGKEAEGLAEKVSIGGSKRSKCEKEGGCAVGLGVFGSLLRYLFLAVSAYLLFIAS